MRIQLNFIKGLCTLFALSLLTGCWDRTEIEDRAIVLGMSIDIAEPKEAENEEEIAHKHGDLPIPNQDMLQVAIQIALPGRIPLGPGQGGGEGASSKDTIWVISLTGHTIADAIANLQQEISGKIFFGHLRIVVVSEELAKKGLQEVNMFLRRNAEVRTTSWMIVSNGKAETLLKAAPKLDRIPTLYLLSTLEEGIKMGKIPLDILAAYWARSNKKGQEGTLIYVEKKKGENINIAGLVVFKNEQMVGILDPFEALAYLGIRGENPAGHPISVRVPGTDNTVTAHTIKRKSKLDSEIKNGLPSFTIDAEIDLQLDEKSSKDVVLNDKMLKQLEKEIAKRIEENFTYLIKQTQKYESDIIGFGEIVRAKQSKYWNGNIRMKEKWQQMYKDVQIDVHVTTKIRRVGMTAW